MDRFRWTERLLVPLHAPAARRGARPATGARLTSGPRAAPGAGRSRGGIALTLAAGYLLAAGGGPAAAQDRQAKILEQFEEETGLARVEVPGADGEYLGKTHRGYGVLFTVKAGDVWGRYAARLAIGEIGREVGGVLAFMTGSRVYGSGPAGSTLDRLLADAIGQPLSLTMMLQHGRQRAPRLDLYPGYAQVKPEEELPERGKLGSGAGTLRSADEALAARLTADEELVKRLKKLRGAYLRVDDLAVTLFWAGREKDYSAMIRDHGGYWEMINSFLDDLADVADLLPEATTVGLAHDAHVLLVEEGLGAPFVAVDLGSSGERARRGQERESVLHGGTAQLVWTEGRAARASSSSPWS